MANADKYYEDVKFFTLKDDDFPSNPEPLFDTQHDYTGVNYLGLYRYFDFQAALTVALQIIEANIVFILNNQNVIISEYNYYIPAIETKRLFIDVNGNEEFGIGLIEYAKRYFSWESFNIRKLHNIANLLEKVFQGQIVEYKHHIQLSKREIEDNFNDRAKLNAHRRTMKAMGNIVTAINYIKRINDDNVEEIRDELGERWVEKILFRLYNAIRENEKEVDLN